MPVDGALTGGAASAHIAGSELAQRTIPHNTDDRPAITAPSRLPLNRGRWKSR
jgi:hypothetical protein